jgi:hypothetical protein
LFIWSTADAFSLVGQLLGLVDAMQDLGDGLVGDAVGPD